MIKAAHEKGIFPMTQTLMNDDTLNELPALDLDAVRPALLQLARTTVDKTLQQARASGSDPVLGRSSALATFYMMMLSTAE